MSLQSNTKTSRQVVNSSQAPVRYVPRVRYSGVTRLELKVDHSPPLSAVIRNQQNYTSISSIRLQGTRKDNFAWFLHPYAL